ncbi:histidine-type phosphatase [Streptomyces olivaceoviridis]|uniref:histidine-type phosphatase n=1 Tax=Streptomyces olivaceoviridis TaxID=1921 RepID=UPI0036B6D169
MWDQAEAEGQLTGKGEEFGDLSGRGKRELADTAVHMRRRLPALFEEIADAGERIDVVSSGQGRAVDSGTAFTDALAEADPALAPLIGPARTDKDLLYFHKAAGGAAYREYIAGDQRLKDTPSRITGRPRTRQAARGVLRKIFKDAFVERIPDQVGAAEAVYDLYAIAPAMIEESPGGAGWGMERGRPAGRPVPASSRWPR